MRTQIAATLALVVACTSALQTQSVGPTPALNADQIGQRLEAANAQRDANLRGYTSRRLMTVTFQSSLGQGVAHETVEMYYTAPGPKKFAIIAADGPQFIRDAVFERAIDSEAAAAAPEAKPQAAMTRANYTMQLLGEQQQPQGDCYVLQVTPRTSSPYAFAGKIWVQATDFAVVRIEGKPVQDVSMWVTGGQFTTTYGKFGPFYFPTETTSASQIRLGGEASLTIRYGPYSGVSGDAVH